MPKVRQLHKIVAYDKEGNFFAEIKLRSSCYNELFSRYLEMCQLLTDGQFPHVSRLDLVGAGHVLFMFCDVRSCVNQLNKCIKIQCYD